MGGGGGGAGAQPINPPLLKNKLISAMKTEYGVITLLR